jgi:hypothetical protein
MAVVASAGVTHHISNDEVSGERPLSSTTQVAPVVPQTISYQQAKAAVLQQIKSKGTDAMQLVGLLQGIETKVNDLTHKLGLLNAQVLRSNNGGGGDVQQHQPCSRAGYQSTTRPQSAPSQNLFKAESDLMIPTRHFSSTTSHHHQHHQVSSSSSVHHAPPPPPPMSAPPPHNTVVSGMMTANQTTVIPPSKQQPNTAMPLPLPLPTPSSPPDDNHELLLHKWNKWVTTTSRTHDPHTYREPRMIEFGEKFFGWLDETTQNLAEMPSHDSHYYNPHYAIC